MILRSVLCVHTSYVSGMENDFICQCYIHIRSKHRSKDHDNLAKDCTSKPRPNTSLICPSKPPATSNFPTKIMCGLAPLLHPDPQRQQSSCNDVASVIKLSRKQQTQRRSSRRAYNIALSCLRVAFTPLHPILISSKQTTNYFTKHHKHVQPFEQSQGCLGQERQQWQRSHRGWTAAVQHREGRVRPGPHSYVVPVVSLNSAHANMAASQRSTT